MTKVECTLILKRIYAAEVARVWAAWTSAEELAQWYIAGEDHVVHFAEADVRVGGGYRVGFGPKGAEPYIETGTYLEVTPLVRLVFQESVSQQGATLFEQRTVVEFRDLGGGRTEVSITATGEEAWRTGGGWTPALQSLGRYLGA
jgi:uncharacterized protein YndB with AHSA1/START domain